MAFPDGVRTRLITCGASFLPVEDTEGRGVVTRVEVESSRALVWDGQLIVPADGIHHTSTPGGQVSFLAVVGDMVGMVDAESMQVIDISGGEVTHTLRVKISYLHGRRLVGGRTVIVPVLTGTEPLDLDRAVVSGTVEGVPVLVEDVWGALIEQAAATVQEMADAVGGAQTVVAAAESARDAAVAAQSEAEGAATAAAGSVLAAATAQAGAVAAEQGAVAARDGMVVSGAVVGDDLVLSTVGGGDHRRRECPRPSR